MEIPLCIHSTGGLYDKTNHRPISLATVKIKILYKYLNSQIKLNDAQFGFCEDLSTESAILALKRTVDYVKRSGVVGVYLYMHVSWIFLRHLT